MTELQFKGKQEDWVMTLRRKKFYIIDLEKSLYINGINDIEKQKVHI